MKTKLAEEEHKKNLGIIPVIDTIKGTLTYGLYPQTHVNDAATITALNALTSAESNGWYLLNGEYYAKIIAEPYNSVYIFNDGTTMEPGTSYWFKCEPIEWKILASNGGTYSLVSLLLLDAHKFDFITENRGHAYDYKGSGIREWLNGDFLNIAFNLDSSLIQIRIVDNSAWTTYSSNNIYVCDDTIDMIYLLSYNDYLNADYGFSRSTESTTTRTCKLTDYAFANYFTNENGNGCYWTRSPCGRNFVSLVDDDGSIKNIGDVSFYYGVRPALTIKL